MSVLSDLWEPVFLLIALMGLGFGLGRGKVLTPSFNEGLTKLLLRWTLPALILVSMQRPFQEGDLVQIGQALGISFAVYGASFVLSWVWPWVLGKRQDARGVFQFVTLFSNVGFMGFPVLEALFGRQILFLAALYNLPFNLLAFTLGVVLLRQGSKNGKLEWVHVLNPGALASLTGLVLFFFQVSWPQPIFRLLEWTGGVTTPLSMILVGSLLAQGSLRTAIQDGALWGLSLVRLILIPLLLLLAAAGLGWRGEVIQIAVVIAAMPAAANTPILAHAHSQQGELAGQSVFLTTALSLGTLPLLLWAVRSWL